jgi:Tfp pilus assembly protein PilF
MRASWLFGALAVILLSACGGGGNKRQVVGAGGRTKEHRDPVKPGARKEFEAAMRALRLGGPEADETARARLRAAVKEDGTIWEAWYDLGVIAWREGDDDEAIDDYSKALNVDRNHNSIVLARAEAVDILRAAIKTSGANAKIYTELGQIYVAQKRLELAQLVLAKALELDAKDPATYNALAILAMKNGRAQEAFERFDQAANLDANFIDARFNKASVLLDAGDYARAKTELAAIVEKRPDDFAAAVALGVAHRGLKEFPEAKKVWDRVIKEAPKKSSARADAMWNITILKLDFMEDAAGGKADLERYLQEAPASHAKRQDAENKCKEIKCR